MCACKQESEFMSVCLCEGEGEGGVYNICARLHIDVAYGCEVVLEWYTRMTVLNMSSFLPTSIRFDSERDEETIKQFHQERIITRLYFVCHSLV